MRTTIRLPDSLLREAKKLAAETDRTLTSVIEDALRAAVRGRPHNGEPIPSVRLTTYGRKGTLPGVDLDDSAALLDRM
ncbi:MAG TPA: YlcI/YnfO family protein [Gemmatimonadota bacterium]|nr:YlcI/YnfO family protein [Gemmatimonadota bacterium]